MSVTWKRVQSDVVRAELDGANFVYPTFTAADLEAGMKVLREKPVFRGYNGAKFQKQADGVVRIDAEGVSKWIRLEEYCATVSLWTPASLRAIADALES